MRKNWANCWLSFVTGSIVQHEHVEQCHGDIHGEPAINTVIEIDDGHLPVRLDQKVGEVQIIVDQTKISGSGGELLQLVDKVGELIAGRVGGVSKLFGCFVNLVTFEPLRAGEGGTGGMVSWQNMRCILPVA